MTNIDKCDRARFDAIVVLGCRVIRRRELFAALDVRSCRLRGALERRVTRAAELYGAQIEFGGDPWMVASGGRTWHGVAEADAMREALVALGVPDARIVCERRSMTTRENARYSKTVLEQVGGRHVAVVTCDFHLPRALAHFRFESINAVGIGAPSPKVAWPEHALRRAQEEVALACAHTSRWLRSAKTPRARARGDGA